ncbi:dynein regulatory complex subunit 3 isoform X1 [Hydra vulgaris]|uniref:dynein regulatory complex subunit 3 isoform X1 n=1 Tax=Hydra vulgaris TaxID=6087 RepID=UPI001F5F8335|nr:dynein regulatory complex subunit 3-like [Hydra vulgaris]
MSDLDNEPVIISEKLLTQCVREQGPKGEAGEIAKKEEIDFKNVKELALDYKNILKIENLWQFTQLTKLQLDNNIIEKIEGLSSLVHLEWLDLSFNNIEYIEGLDNLTQLKDLTLFNNRISVINNMDTLVKLNVLSLGNNTIHNLENLIYLRRFKFLNALSLEGNPISKDKDYHAYTIAHLPSLVYLDYRLVDSVKKKTAVEKYRDIIDELIRNDEILEQNLKQDIENQARLTINREAFVDGVECFFDEMLSEDTEVAHLSQISGVNSLLQSYKENFTKVCDKLFKYGIEERLKRNSETELFFLCVKETVEQNRNESVSHIEKFKHDKEQIFTELLNVTEQDKVEMHLTELSESVTQLWNVLMNLEIQLVDQLEETIKDFERNMLDMAGSFVENVQQIVNQLRELENKNHEVLSEIAMNTLEKFMKNELEEEISDDIKFLFIDKDTVMNAVSASHDSHLFKIDCKEDDIVTRINANIRNLIEGLHADEIKRNRLRVCEINYLLDHFRDEIESFDETNEF